MRHNEIAFNMATSYRTKRCIFDPNRIILTMISKSLNFMGKEWISSYHIYYVELYEQNILYCIFSKIKINYESKLKNLSKFFY